LFNGTIRPDWLTGVNPKIESGKLDVINSANSYQYLNPAAFAAVPLSPNGVPLKLGTAPRFLPNIRGPHFFSEDFGIEKRFPFLESRAVEFRADAFNAFNRSGLANPVTDVTSPLFGRITGPQQGPRNIQLSLRVEF